MEGIKQGEDPTEAILSTSGLNSKYLCDYVINVATGCRHGCKFCYTPSTPNIRTRPDMLSDTIGVENPQKEWGEYVLYRDHIGDELPGILERKRKWKETRGGQGIVGISFSTDSFMDKRSGDIAASAIESLSNHQKHTRVLTRNPLLASSYSDTFTEANEYVTVGSSISSLDEEAVSAMEPSAPTTQKRLEGLERLKDMGVNVFVSLSPTYPGMSRDELQEILERVNELEPDVIFHEPINPRGANFSMAVKAVKEAGLHSLEQSLEEIRNEDVWVEYATQHLAWVQQISMEKSIPIHLWPDESLLNKTSGDVQNWVKEWKGRQSVEDFAGRPDPKGEFPTIPKSLR